MKRKIHTDEIKKAVQELIYSANFIVPAEIKNIFREMKKNEKVCLKRLSLFT